MKLAPYGYLKCGLSISRWWSQQEKCKSVHSIGQSQPKIEPVFNGENELPTLSVRKL